MPREQKSGGASGYAMLSDTSVLTWHLWGRLGSSFLSQLGFCPGCGSLFPCPRQDPGKGTLWPSSSPSFRLGAWLPFSSSARAIYPMPASCSILKKTVMGVFAPNLDLAQACWGLHAAIGRGETHCWWMPRVYFSPRICNYLHWLLQALARFKNY